MPIMTFALATLLMQDKQEPNPFENVPVFRHVEVVLKNGNAFKGVVFQVMRPKDAGDGPPTLLVLDISEDFPGIDGTITFKNKNVRSVRVLPELTEEARRRRLEEKLRAIEDRDKNEGVRLQEETDRKAKLAADLAAEEQAKIENRTLTVDEKLAAQKDLNESLAFYKKFPPSDGWGEGKFTELTLKKANNPESLTPQEKEFYASYGKWEQASNYIKKESSGGGGSTPYGKPESTGPRSTMKTEGAVTTVTLSGSPVYE